MKALHKNTLGKTAIILLLSFVLSACGQKAGGTDAKKDTTAPETETTVQETEAKTEAEEEEETLSPEQMELVKYNYYVDLNNDILDVLDDIDAYFMVVDYTEEFALLPDSGYDYGFDISGKNTDIIDDCLQLADMEPAFDELDGMVKEMAEPLRAMMETFSEISGSYDYADNQYQKAKEYHAVIYENADSVYDMGTKYMDAVAQMGTERAAKEEEQMKADGQLIIYNASHGITIGKEVLDEIYAQNITDENITELDLTKIRELYNELVTTVADLDTALADNNQLIKESLSNSRPFDGLYDSLIQALDWMIKQVDSGQPLDLSGSGAPLGSIGHFSETLGKCIDRYNSVFVE